MQIELKNRFFFENKIHFSRGLVAATSGEFIGGNHSSLALLFGLPRIWLYRSHEDR